MTKVQQTLGCDLFRDFCMKDLVMMDPVRKVAYGSAFKVLHEHLGPFPYPVLQVGD